MEGFAAYAGEPGFAAANCAPENVVNAWSRIVDPEHFEWVSDPAEALPQWIELSFPEPETIRSVSVVFDTDLSNPGTCWTSKRPAVPETVLERYFQRGCLPFIPAVYTADVFVGRQHHRTEYGRSPSDDALRFPDRQLDLRSYRSEAVGE